MEQCIGTMCGMSGGQLESLSNKSNQIIKAVKRYD